MEETTSMIGRRNEKRWGHGRVGGNDVSAQLEQINSDKHIRITE